jgi:hypothetical protein
MKSRTFCITILHRTRLANHTQEGFVRAGLVDLIPAQAWHGNGLSLLHGGDSTSLTIGLNDGYEGEWLPRVIAEFTSLVRTNVFDAQPDCLKSLSCVRLD